jgi:hypothetical protein
VRDENFLLRNAAYILELVTGGVTTLIQQHVPVHQVVAHKEDKPRKQKVDDSTLTPAQLKVINTLVAGLLQPANIRLTDFGNLLNSLQQAQREAESKARANTINTTQVMALIESAVHTLDLQIGEQLRQIQRVLSLHVENNTDAHELRIFKDDLLAHCNAKIMDSMNLCFRRLDKVMGNDVTMAGRAKCIACSRDTVNGVSNSIKNVSSTKALYNTQLMQKPGNNEFVRGDPIVYRGGFKMSGAPGNSPHKQMNHSESLPHFFSPNPQSQAHTNSTGSLLKPLTCPAPHFNANGQGNGPESTQRPLTADGYSRIPSGRAFGKRPNTADVAANGVASN